MFLLRCGQTVKGAIKDSVIRCLFYPLWIHDCRSPRNKFQG